MSNMNSDVLKPEHLVPVIDPPKGLSQKNTKRFLVLPRDEATVSCNVEVKLGGGKARSNRVVHSSRLLSLVLQIFITHGFVNFSNTGIVSAPEKAYLQSSEPAAPRLGFVAKKGLASSGKKITSGASTRLHWLVASAASGVFGRYIYKRLPAMKKAFGYWKPSHLLITGLLFFAAIIHMITAFGN